MSGPADPDVPYAEDLTDPDVAAAWAVAADRKRPHRIAIRRAIGERLQQLSAGASVLELGSGPGYLAEQILTACPGVATYTLFDSSGPMLAMSRVRVGAFAAARFVQGDFKHPEWTAAVPGPFDAVVSMQAVHEVRHKRHVPGLYRDIVSILSPSGTLMVCDLMPRDDTTRSAALFMTASEQQDALRQAGFVGIRLVTSGDGLALWEGRLPAVAIPG